ncbi:MAG: hypothetical protein AAGA48_26530 [Myxococcota bacterium]
MIRTLSLLPLLAVGCIFSPDSDEDGLSNAKEKNLGTNPDIPDTDGDGIIDGAEVDEVGTDPLVADTDGDTYVDGDELDFGSDPLDADDLIYTGLWPYNADKDSIDDPGFSGEGMQVGDIFPRHTGKDQFRDTVDTYDFANQGKYTVIDGSATWCPPCQAVASWIAGDADPFNLETDYASVRRKLNRGQFQWLTVMTDGGPSAQELAPAPIAEVIQWDEDFPNENVVVMRDNNAGDMLFAINQSGGGGLAWPTYVIVDENMEVVVAGGTGEILDFLLENL